MLNKIEHTVLLLLLPLMTMDLSNYAQVNHIFKVSC